MRTIDYVFFFGYLVVILGIGLRHVRRSGPAPEFLLAGRSMRWFPVGLSVMTAVFSAVNFTAFSGETATQGLYVLMALPAFLLAAVPVMGWIIPFYHRLQPVSAYEILERRFDRRVRRLASGLFILWRTAWMAIVLYATCRPMSTVTHMNFHVLLLLAGTVTIVYTVAGGMRSVMWTDVAQFLVLIGGLLAGLAIVSFRGGGFGDVLALAFRDGLMRPFRPFDPDILSWDPRIRMTLWSCVIGSFVAFLARYGADQMVVQRYFTARTLRDARMGFLLNIGCTLLALVCLALLGLAVHAHWAGAGLLAGPASRPSEQLAHFLTSLPFGICGLLVAGLFASGMMDSGIHACATAASIDFAGRWTRSPRALTVFFGILIMVLACGVGRLGSIFEIANKVVNGLGAPLLALFLAAWIRRGFSSTGVLIGGLGGAAWSVYVSFFVQNLALHYYAVANFLGTFLLCAVCSWLFRATQKSMR